jgi:hypothetical protein
MQWSIFPLKEFDDWEAIIPKNVPSTQNIHQGSIHSLNAGNSITQHGWSNEVHTPKSEYVQHIW